MKTTTIKHKSTGNTCEAEIYSSFVYLVDEMRQISKQDFNDFYEVVVDSDYFVYQNWTNETLYSKNKSFQEAEVDFNTLNSLIESGSVGDGCACIGRLSEPTDFNVAKRLGLLN